jgi:hypothetical protein
VRPCFPPEGPKAFRAGLIQVRASKTAGRDFSNPSICLEAHRVDLRRVTKGPDGGTIAPRGEVALRRILGMLCNEQGGWQDCSTTDLFRPQHPDASHSTKRSPLLCGTSHRHTALSIQWHSLSQPEACTRNHNAHHTSVKWNKDLTRHLANHTKNVTRRWFLVVTNVNVPLLVILGVRHPLRVSCLGLAVLSVTEGYYRSVIRYSNRHAWTGI